VSHDTKCLGHNLNLGPCTYEAAVVLVLSHIIFLGCYWTWVPSNGPPSSDQIVLMIQWFCLPVQN